MKFLERRRDIRTFKRLARAIGSRSVDSEAEPHYELLSDALIWSDELPLDRLPHEWWDVRPLLHHRTCLIMGESSKYGELWQLGLRFFPNWPGFLPERRASREEYKAQVTAKRAEWKAWCIEHEDKAPSEW